MITATLQEAKAKLNKLVDQARSGEDVVLLRGSKVVARLQSLSEMDLEVTAVLTDAQAERFWSEVEKTSEKFKNPQTAIQHLKKIRRSKSRANHSH